MQEGLSIQEWEERVKFDSFDNLFPLFCGICVGERRNALRVTVLSVGVMKVLFF